MPLLPEPEAYHVVPEAATQRAPPPDRGISLLWSSHTTRIYARAMGDPPGGRGHRGAFTRI